MKNLLLLLLLMTFGKVVHAQKAPTELLELFPENSDNIIFEGETDEGEVCKTTMAIQKQGFEAYIMTLNPSQPDLAARYVRFDVGFRRGPLQIENAEDTLILKTRHSAEEVYSSPTRSKMTINFGDNKSIVSVRIKEDRKGFFFWDTRDEIECFAN